MMEATAGVAVARSGKSNSPFRYPGGKFYARRLILDCLPAIRTIASRLRAGLRSFLPKTERGFRGSMI